MSLSLSKEKNIIIGVLIATAIFMADLNSPLWYDVWVLYLIPLFFIFQSAKRPYVYSAIVTLLTLAGLFLHHADNTPLMHSAVNRITGIFGGWGVSVLLMRLKHLHVSLLQSHHELEELVEQRTGELVSLEEAMADREEAEVKLRKSEEAYRWIVETTREGVWSLDRQNLTTFVNVAMAQMLGYANEEMIGTPLERYIFDEDLRDYHLRSEARQSGIYEHFEQRYRRKEGEACWCLVSAAPLQDAEGRFVGSFFMCIDITKRKKMEESLRKLEEQLRQSQKMEAIGTLAGGVAHDFNNILTAITGYASLVQERLKKDKMAQEYIGEVLNAANRAVELTRGLLAFSRKQTISLKQKDLNDIVQNVQKMLARIIGEDIKLKTALSSRRLPVSVDSVQIDQVLLNLAANARDAMPDGGHLIIETDVVDMDESYVEAHLIESTGKYAVLTVSDTGIGMDHKTKENIFEPFFTTKGVGKGTGLGLAMVYGIIKQHGGTINVYSEVGKGTTFRIYLPILKTAEKEEAEAAHPIPFGNGEKILIAEDDAQVRKILSISLKRHGYEVVEAGTGEEAVNSFLENRDTTAILLLDVIMPGNNGREAYEKIKLIEPGIKAIFMSGYTDDIISRNGILEEGFDFVSKPINPDTLMRKIRYVLDR